MAKTLVLEWDSREARVIAITQKGRKWTVDEAFAVALPARDAAAGDKIVGPMLKEVLAKRGLAGSKCKVVVGRTSIELRYLTVPQAPLEEMPDLVRFQALRQFSQLGEEWPLDFIPVSDSGETQLVLAASIVPSALDGLKDVCTHAGLVADQVYLRPFAAAANIADEAVAEGQERRLIVDVLTDEADLVVVDRGRPIFCRTVKLPAGPDATEARNISLVGEIRRTVAAAQNQIPGAEITHVSLFGVASENATIVEKLKQSHFTAEAIDPFAEVDPVQLTEIKPAQRGSFAPLLGVMHLLSGASTPSIDFLHTRQRPQPPDNRRRNVLGLAAALMLVLAGLTGYYYWSESLAGQVRNLDEQIKKTNSDAKKYTDVRLAAEAIENFEKTNINLADKLAKVSTELPPGDKVILTRLDLVAPQLTLARNGKLQELPGSLTLEGGAKENADVSAILKRLEPLGRVKNENTVIGSKVPGYTWGFKDTLFIDLSQIANSTPNPRRHIVPKDGDKASKPSGSAATSKKTTAAPAPKAK